jgi:proteic killer suppression protein
MIKTYACKHTERLFNDYNVLRFKAISVRARLKLAQLDGAKEVEDLRLPPGNMLELLHRERVGQWSIRISGKYRICFNWVNGDAYNVEIVDYH